MTAIEQADALTAQAVNILLAERDAIDARLQQLGQNKTANGKRRGRPPKQLSDTATLELASEDS